MTNFASLGLAKKLVAGLDAAGIKDPTPIQQHAIPLALEGRDIMGLAQTGTGKTAAFGLPLIQQMMQFGTKPDPRTIRGLVLAPTRELAKQIQDNLRNYLGKSPMKVGMVVGGQSINAQSQRLSRGTDIVVATPGRLLDLLNRKAVTLNATRFLVLDEADQMLDMGFIHDLRKIAGYLPEKRQTMLFSATMPKLMAEIAESFLNNPERVQVSPPGRVADKITQEVHFVAQPEKTELLKEFLSKHTDERALVFARTKHGAERLMKHLVKAGFEAASIHGNKTQGQRDRAIAGFRDGAIKVLVATDVAARGIDIPDVKHVYNYDLPNVPDNFVHRIGRTARAGAEGRAIAFCAPDEASQLRAIQKVMKLEIPVGSGTPPAGLTPHKKPARGAKPGGKPGNNNRRRPQRRRNRGPKKAA
ncbi:DEAD/DEAH box helicase [Actibacterium mucosum KCTC 23349]|uniref:DEAD-box ATP-dependent RNA helicase RhpA n=1 Tax=Actibacterium mucosum KCTC 23349 TaxID=1454373 RepID=A0A037ZHL7_9RHOB|nr:DEAD/DEAH box helicase [Actibacterium mucosum]KAJ55037.1 DEAD/DEAH box helicase [Actibacterium mucosum KCTC 23349]